MVACSKIAPMVDFGSTWFMKMPRDANCISNCHILGDWPTRNLISDNPFILTLAFTQTAVLLRLNCHNMHANTWVQLCTITYLRHKYIWNIPYVIAYNSMLLTLQRPLSSPNVDSQIGRHYHLAILRPTEEGLPLWSAYPFRGSCWYEHNSELPNFNGAKTHTHTLIGAHPCRSFPGLHVERLWLGLSLKRSEVTLTSSEDRLQKTCQRKTSKKKTLFFIGNPVFSSTPG